MTSLDSATRSRQSQLVSRIVAESRRPANLGMVANGAVSLAMGEPFSDTPDAVTQAAVAALSNGRTRYSPLSGAPALREATAAHLSKTPATPIDASQVVLTHGASAGIAALMLSILDAGDRVVIPDPTYSLYADHVAMAGGTVTWVAPDSNGDLDVAAVTEATKGARAVILCNPSNPTGRVIGREQLEAVGAAAAELGAALIVDEAYADIVFDELDFHSVLSLEKVDESYCIGTFSKSYAMTGWRLGYVIAQPSTADAINLVHRTINGALNTFVQDAAMAALALPDFFHTEMRGEYQQRRDLVMDRLGDLPFLTLSKPQGAFYAFPRIESQRSSQDLTNDLASRGGVLVRSGSEYGPSGEGHLRLSFATDLASLEAGLDRFVATLPGLL